MWIFTKYGFYSISADGNIVWVRSRVRQHLQNLKNRFPDFEPLAGARIKTSKKRDYKFRLKLQKIEWAAILSELSLEQDWNNFKDEAQKFERENHQPFAYVDALHDIWQTMFEVQTGIKSRKGLKATQCQHDWSKSDICSKCGTITPLVNYTD